MIKIELKHIRKGGIFRFENNTKARVWIKGKRDSSKKKTWAYSEEQSAKLVEPEREVFTKIQFIKPSKALDVFSLKYV